MPLSPEILARLEPDPHGRKGHWIDPVTGNVYSLRSVSFRVLTASEEPQSPQTPETEENPSGDTAEEVAGEVEASEEPQSPQTPETEENPSGDTAKPRKMRSKA